MSGGGPLAGPVVVLDAQAVSLLADNDGRNASRDIASAIKAAHNMGRPVVTPAVVLAENYRHPNRIAAANSAISRLSPIEIRHTDTELAIYVGGVLGAAGAGSADMVDAHCIAVAVEAGGRAVVLTSDPKDMTRLSAGHPAITIQAI